MLENVLIIFFINKETEAAEKKKSTSSLQKC